MGSETAQPGLRFRAASDARILAQDLPRIEQFLDQMASAQSDQERRDLAHELATQVPGVELLGEALRRGRREAQDLLEGGGSPPGATDATLQLAEKLAAMPQVIQTLQHVMPGSFADTDPAPQATALRVKVTRTPQHYEVQASDDARAAAARFTEDDLEAVMADLSHVRDFIEEIPGEDGAGPKDDDLLRAFGARLFALLFARDTLALFETWQQGLVTQARPTLLLELDPSAQDLDQLPWELMVWRERFLLADRHIDIVRLVGSSLLGGQPAIDGPVDTLLIASDPTDAEDRGMAPLRVEEEQAAMREALSDAIAQGRATPPRFEEDATVDLMGKRLSQGPQVVHVLAHGFDAGVALQTAGGRTDPLDIDRFASLLATNPRLRLAFLSSCRTARSSEANQFMPLASRLAEDGVPAVVGMGHSICFGDNRRLLAAFYDAFVLNGMPLGQALLNARCVLYGTPVGRGSWSIPVLYAAAPQSVQLKVRPGEPAPGTATTYMLTGLPYMAERFVGRREDLREFRRFLLGRDQHRVAVVRGISGIGKSALVRQCIEKVKPELEGSFAHQFDAGQTAPFEDFMEGVGDWLDRLGSPSAAGKVRDADLPDAKRVRALVEAVATSRVAIVLDSVENVLDGRQVRPPFDAILEAFLSEGPRAKLVLTTNRDLDVPNAERHAASAAVLSIEVVELKPEESDEYVEMLPTLKSFGRKQRNAVVTAVGGAPMWLNLIDARLGNLSVSPATVDVVAIAREVDQTQPAELVRSLQPELKEKLARFCLFRRPVDGKGLDVVGLADDELDALLESFLLTRDPDTKLYFTHQLLKTALRDALTDAEQRRAHLAIARYYDEYLFPEVGKRMRELEELGLAGTMETLALIPGGQSISVHIQACAHYLLAHEYKRAAGLLEQMGDHLIDSGRSKELAALLDAIPEHKTRHRPEIVRLRADLHARWGQWDQARELYARLLDRQEKALHRRPDDPERISGLATAEHNLGTLLSRRGRLEEAVPHYRAALRAYKQLLADDPESVTHQSGVAMTESNLGSLLLAQGRLEEAVQHYEAALDVRKRLLMAYPDSVIYQSDVAITEDNLGNLLLHQGRLDGSAEHFGAALSIREQLLAGDSGNGRYQSDVATSEDHLGSLLARQGRLEEAGQHYRAALRGRKQLLTAEPYSVRYQSDVAATENNLGVLLSDQGHLEEAAQHYGSALAARQQLLAGDPDSVTYQSDVAATENNLGTLLSDQGQLEEAAQHYRAAMSAYKQLLMRHPDSVTYQSHLATTEHNLGNVLSGQGRLEEATQHYRAALSARKQMLAREPDNVTYQSYLATTENSLGNMLTQQGRLEEAVQHYRTALSAYMQLLAGDPDSVTYQSHLATAENSLGSLLTRQGRLEEAAQHLGAALNAQRQLLVGDPDSVTYQSDVAKTENNLGLLLSDQGRPREAVQHYQQSLELCAGLYGSDPSNATVARRLAEVSFNVARLRIQTGETADGVDGLKQAALLFLNAGWSQGIGSALTALAQLVGQEDAEPASTEAAIAFAANAPSDTRKELMEKLSALPEDASPTAHVLLVLLRAGLEGKPPGERAGELFQAPPDALAPLASFVRAILAGKEPPAPEDLTPWEHLLRLHLAMLLRA